MSAGSPGCTNRASRSYFKSWQTEVFGKDWLYDLFVAFGYVDREMVQCLNEACVQRAEEKRESMDPATSRDTQFGRLSGRSRAALYGFAMPPVEGMTKKRTEAYEAREAARQMVEELNVVKYKDMRAYENGRADLTPNHVWLARADVVDRAWQEAMVLSYAAGHTFTDRWGAVHHLSAESIVARAVRLYFEEPRKRSWLQVAGWKHTYLKPASAKTGPVPKRRRR